MPTRVGNGLVPNFARRPHYPGDVYVLWHPDRAGRVWHCVRRQDGGVERLGRASRRLQPAWRRACAAAAAAYGRGAVRDVSAVVPATGGGDGADDGGERDDAAVAAASALRCELFVEDADKWLHPRHPPRPHGGAWACGPLCRHVGRPRGVVAGNAAGGGADRVGAAGARSGGLGVTGGRQGGRVCGRGRSPHCLGGGGGGAFHDFRGHHYVAVAWCWGRYWHAAASVASSVRGPGERGHFHVSCSLLCHRNFAGPIASERSDVFDSVRCWGDSRGGGVARRLPLSVCSAADHRPAPVPDASSGNGRPTNHLPTPLPWGSRGQLGCDARGAEGIYSATLRAHGTPDRAPAVWASLPQAARAGWSARCVHGSRLWLNRLQCVGRMGGAMTGVEMTATPRLPSTAFPMPQASTRERRWGDLAGLSGSLSLFSCPGSHNAHLSSHGGAGAGDHDAAGLPVIHSGGCGAAAPCRDTVFGAAPWPAGDSRVICSAAVAGQAGGFLTAPAHISRLVSCPRLPRTIRVRKYAPQFSAGYPPHTFTPLVWEACRRDGPDTGSYFSSGLGEKNHRDALTGLVVDGSLRLCRWNAGLCWPGLQ